ncbi:hypothetical protein [Chitinophaga niabensis]|uniref:Entericidin n=1 Tax=Chitinophaga niabensis TaxID=536979 RepID=A0A1N6KF22_9BACT|nr:hypothetical protein [Chitinophaga niabensis]SIO55165.1 hypothetical protein SAMN04488055_5732 [Chitinophaga niabensis]
MKKLFVLAIATGMFVACNNASTSTTDSTTTTTDSSALNAAPAVDSAATVDSAALAPVDSAAAHADSTHKH